MKNVIRLILMLCGALLLIYTVITACVFNFNMGIVFCGILAVVVGAAGIFFENLCNIKWLTVIFAAAMAVLILFMSFIFIYGQSDNTKFDEDAVIVLGAGLHGDKVSQQLAYRLDKAFEYSQKNPNAVIVVSGGQGADEDITEALAMERYLIEKGVSAERIIREEKSVSTYTNLVNTKEILDKKFDGEYKAVLITSDYHMYRARKTAHKAGINCTAYHSEIEWYSGFMRYIRECAAVAKYIVLGK